MEGSRLCSNPLSQRDGMQARAGKCAEQAGRNDRARLDNHVLPPFVSLWHGAAIIRREPDPVQRFIIVARGAMERLPIWAHYSLILGPKPPVGSTHRRFVGKKSGIRLSFCLKWLFSGSARNARKDALQTSTGWPGQTGSQRCYCFGSLLLCRPCVTALRSVQSAQVLRHSHRALSPSAASES